MTEHDAITERSTISELVRKYQEADRRCCFPGCEKPVFGHGLCQGHCVQRRKGKELRSLNFIRPLVPNENKAGTVLVPLTKGLVAVIDECDAEAVSRFNWHARKGLRKGPSYAQFTRTDGYGRTIVTTLHRFLWTSWGNPDAEVIDHKNGDGLDCTRENLRAASASDNARNVSKRANNTSGFKGVSFHKATGKFSAQIVVNGKSRHLGLFRTADAAAVAYDDAAKRLFGEFAKLNVIAGGANLKPVQP